jgi:hypothetical protein
MTKKEQAAMQAAIDRAELLAALRWTAPVEPDVMPPKEGYSEGWAFNSHSGVIDQRWSTSVFHGSGPAPKQGRHLSATQGPQRLFSTKEKAIAALRHATETKAAYDLLKIDRMPNTP